MDEKLKSDINQVLIENGVPATQEIAVVMLYHTSEQATWHRLNLFFQVFRRQFARAYPSVRLNWETICLPGAYVDNVLPALRGPHILLAVVSVECLLELHLFSSLYEALVSCDKDTAHHIGIVARSVPLDKDPIRFSARFPADVPSLALCQEDDEVLTEVMQHLWSSAARLSGQL